METKETELVQLVRQLRDYVILDRKDYEKLVQNSKPTECSVGIKLAIPVAMFIKYVTVAKKLIKDDKDANKKILSIRLKIANKEAR